MNSCQLVENESKYIRELKEILIERNNDHTDYEGGAEAEHLFKNQYANGMLFYMKAGEKMPMHKHESKEHIIVIKGSFTTWIEGQEYKIEETEIITFFPNESHGGVADEDLICVCISIPPEESYA